MIFRKSFDFANPLFFNIEDGKIPAVQSFQLALVLRT